jgi:hypothetical protein
VSAGNKGACDLRATSSKTIRVETISAKVKNFFTLSGRRSDDAVLVAEGAFLFHTVKHPSS